MLYRRGRTWWVRFTIGGREVRRSARTTVRAEAEEFETTLRSQAWRESSLGERTHTWDGAALAFVESQPHKRSGNKDAEIIVWVKPHLSGVRLEAITPERLRGLQAKKAEESSPQTANRYMAFIRAVLRFAVEQGMTTRAPKVRMYRVEKPDPRWITRDQFEVIVAGLRPLQADIARFAVCTGLRRSNITHLRWEQVDLERRLVVVPGMSAKARKPIPVPLNDEALAVLSKHHGRHPEWVFARVKAGVPFVYTTTRRWRENCSKAGVPGFRFHDLRHTWATWHILNGTPLHVLQELGGWASYEMVRRYAHLNPEHLAGWAGNIGGQISAQGVQSETGTAPNA